MRETDQASGLKTERNQEMKNVLSLTLSVVLAGCAVQPGSGVGNGRYLQILNGTEVGYEYDVVAAGHQNCPNQASAILQQNPNSSVRCAHEPTSQPMPFSFKAEFTNASDGFYPSGPYLVRLSTSARCKSVMEATRAQPKSVIREDNCRLPTPAALTPPPAAETWFPTTVQPSTPTKPVAQPKPEGGWQVTSPAPARASPTVPPMVNNTGRDEANSLQKLNELRDKGLISQDEYDKKRKEILDRL